MRKKMVIKNVISSLLLQVVAIICGFIVPRLIIDNYGSSINGIIVSITQFLSYITLLEAGFGPVIKSTLYKPIAENNKEKISSILRTTESFFKKISLIFIIYIVLLMVIYPFFVGQQLDKITTMLLIAIIAISTFAEYFFGMTYMLFLQADQKNYLVAYIQIISKIINTIIIVILINFNSSILIVKLISSIVFAIKPLLQNIYVNKKYNIDLKQSKEKLEIPQKWDGMAQHIAYTIHTNTDIIVLTIFSNVVNVSIYSVYSLVITGIRNIIKSFSSGIESTFGNMFAKNENENLNIKFKLYEFVYFMIITIMLTVTIIMIIPFISVYTKGIKDAEYLQPVFAYLLVLAETFYAIRKPYHSIVLSTGKFKETQKGAWVEAICNIVISIILVKKFGLIGVAIGTLVAMIIRTIDLIVFTSKSILKRSIFIPIKRIVILFVNMILIVLINNILRGVYFTKIDNYVMWICYGIIITIISTVITVTTNSVLYFDDFKRVLKLRTKKGQNIEQN